MQVALGVKGPDLPAGDVYVIWPDQVSYSISRQVNIWALEPGSYTCAELLAGKARPEQSVLSSLTTTVPPSGATVLYNLAQEVTVFFVEAQDDQGVLLFNACGREVARKNASIVLHLVRTDALCETDVDCDDQDKCTKDRCDGLRCFHDRTPIPGAEGPQGDATCSNGVDDDCDGLIDSTDPNCNPCALDSDCEDQNSCTHDSCSDGICSNLPVANGTNCEDGLFCTMEESCQNGVCGNPMGSPCSGPDGDDDCKESCNETDKKCNANDPDGSKCDDGDECTIGDSCSQGVCEAIPKEPTVKEGASYRNCNNGIDDDCDGLTDTDEDCAGCIGNGTFGDAVENYTNTGEIAGAVFGKFQNEASNFDDIALLLATGQGSKDLIVPLKIVEKNGDARVIELGLEVGNNSYGITSADFNKDGKVDIAVTSLEAEYYILSVFYGTEASGGPFGSEQKSVQDSWIGKIVAGDFGNDGRSDLAVGFMSLADANKVGILKNNGYGGFQDREISTVDDVCPTGGKVTALCVADVNSDHVPDILVGCEKDGNSMGSFRVLMGIQGDPTSFNKGPSCSIGGSVVDIALGEFTGDKTLDVALASREDAKIYVLQGKTDNNVPNGSFDCSNSRVTSLRARPSGLDSAFFDSDDILDIVVCLDYNLAGDSQENIVEVLFGNAQQGSPEGVFRPGPEFELKDESGINRYPGWVHARDLDHDGAVDIITGTSTMYQNDWLVVFWANTDCSK